MGEIFQTLQRTSWETQIRTPVILQTVGHYVVSLFGKPEKMFETSNLLHLKTSKIWSCLLKKYGIN